MPSCNSQDYLLSIITVTYNAENTIEKTLKSVLFQKGDECKSIQYIIQDGKSTDETIAIIKKYSFLFRNKGVSFSFYIEQDKGIYDAMNKGIQKARGKWICLLNAGDTFENEYVFVKLYPYLVYSFADVLYSDYFRVNSYLKERMVIPNINNLRNTMIFCHQALFIRDNIYRQKDYNLKFKLVADYDFVLKLFLYNFRFEHINDALIDYDLDGISAQKLISTYKEIRKVRVSNKIIKENEELGIYILGIFKRLIISVIPQPIRWKIYKIVKTKK